MREGPGSRCGRGEGLQVGEGGWGGWHRPCYRGDLATHTGLGSRRGEGRGAWCPGALDVPQATVAHVPLWGRQLVPEPREVRGWAVLGGRGSTALGVHSPGHGLDASQRKARLGAGGEGWCHPETD